APFICYDLRFPVWMRNHGDYDLILVVANWPESRRDVWKNLLVARAIENQTYVLGVNRIGRDGLGISYAGDTRVINPRGEVLFKAEFQREQMLISHLDKKKLVQFREQFPVWKDADRFSLDANP
ncbi:MAG: nitrilase, partial [Bacteroidales bacterium]|nr:nitrilase [Bacteroidales bacterium]